LLLTGLFYHNKCIYMIYTNIMPHELTQVELNLAMTSLRVGKMR